MIQKLLKITVAVLLVGMASCSKEEPDYINHHVVAYPDGTVLKAEDVDAATASTLDLLVESLFTNDIDGETTERHIVINSQYDLYLMGVEDELDIDFGTKSLFVGCIPSYTSADSIGDITVVYDAPGDLYHCTIDVYRPQDGYAVVQSLRYWRVFPKVESEVLYNINDITN